MSVDAPQELLSLALNPRLAVLVALLITAAVIDCRTMRIPNWLTAGGMLFGLLYNTVATAPWSDGLLGSLAGLAVGLVILLPVYALGVMGAGDVKLMAMVGAFVGFPDILHAVLYSLIVGGVAAIGFSISRRAFRRMSANVFDIVQSMAFAAMVGSRPSPTLAARTSIGKFPYAVSIAGGTIGWLGARLLGIA